MHNSSLQTLYGDSEMRSKIGFLKKIIKMGMSSHELQQSVKKIGWSNARTTWYLAISQKIYYGGS